MQTTLQVVPSGPYFGFTLTAGTNSGNNLEDELTRYLAARSQSGSRLTASGINGQSFQFGPRADWSLDEWQMQLQAAFYYLDPGRYPLQPPTNSSAVAFA